MPLPTPSSLRDRTPEFLAAAERISKQLAASTSGNVSSLASGTSSLKHSQHSRDAPGASNFSGGGLANGRDTQAHQIAMQSEFAKKASDIGHGIHRTSLKLQKLAQLAKRTSMFDDPTAEVEELTGIIKQDIQALNAGIAELQRVSQRGPQADNKQSHDHSHTVVDNLRSRLKDATAEFKDVLTVRTETLKHHKERRQLFSANTDADAAVPLLQHRRQAAASSAAGSSGTAPPGAMGMATQPSSFAPPPPPSFLQTTAQQQQQQQQLMLAAPQDTYLSSRAEALRNVESTIVELGSIFTKLSEMVAEQGEMAIRIDENVDETLSNVTSAQDQLLKYLNSISSNRWLVLKVFGVLLIFLIFFIMFIA